MIRIYAETIEQAVMEYIEKHCGIPCSELEKYSQTLTNSGYRELVGVEKIDSRFVSTKGDLRCAKIEIDVPIDLDVE